MTLPASIAKHIHISEREVAHTWPDGRKDDAAWEDCGYTSLIEFIRLAYRPDLPATHAFAEKIRARIEGPLGGSTPAELIAAAKTIGASGAGTPGIVLKGYSAANLWAALTPGRVATVSGKMGVFPAGSPMRRWDAGFGGGHQVTVVRIDTQDRVWWCDPLAPSDWAGEWVSKANVIAFAKGLASISFVAPLKAVAVPAPAPAPVPVPPPPPPVVTTYTQAQLDAALAALAASDKTALTTAVLAATKAERERIALAEAARIRLL